MIRLPWPRRQHHEKLPRLPQLPLGARASSRWTIACAIASNPISFPRTRPAGGWNPPNSCSSVNKSTLPLSGLPRNIRLRRRRRAQTLRCAAPPRAPWTSPRVRRSRFTNTHAGRGVVPEVPGAGRGCPDREDQRHLLRNVAHEAPSTGFRSIGICAAPVCASEGGSSMICPMRCAPSRDRRCRSADPGGVRESSSSAAEKPPVRNGVRRSCETVCERLGAASSSAVRSFHPTGRQTCDSAGSPLRLSALAGLRRHPFRAPRVPPSSFSWTEARR